MTRGEHEVLVGSCLDVLPSLPGQHFHACVTSPTYFALRDYGTATWEGGDPGCDHKPPSRQGTGSRTAGKARGKPVPGTGDHDRFYRDICGKCGAKRIDKQIGQEPTAEAFLATMVTVFREVRRVLRNDGILWVNMGDSFSQDGSQFLMPHRFALALQGDGWMLRQTIIGWKQLAVEAVLGDNDAVIDTMSVGSASPDTTILLTQCQKLDQYVRYFLPMGQNGSHHIDPGGASRPGVPSCGSPRRVPGARRL
jgi:hypothetical protein